MGLKLPGRDEISAFLPDQVRGLLWPLTLLGFGKAGLTYFVINFFYYLSKLLKSKF